MTVDLGLRCLHIASGQIQQMTLIIFYLKFSKKTGFIISCKHCIGDSLHEGVWGGKGVMYLTSLEGIQLILAYSWARSTILVAGKGRGGMFLLARLYEVQGELL